MWCQQRDVADQTDTEVQCREHLGRQWLPVGGSWAPWKYVGGVTVCFDPLKCHIHSLHCALASCGAVYCNRSCLWVCDSGRGRAGGVRTLPQPARAVFASLWALFHSKLLLGNFASFASSRTKDLCQKRKIKLLFFEELETVGLTWLTLPHILWQIYSTVCTQRCQSV